MTLSLASDAPPPTGLTTVPPSPNAASGAEPRATVIVPGFNVASYAAEALESLQQQTLRDWSAILIDDESTDGTADIFERAAEGDARFRVVNHARQIGLGAARNTGCAVATGSLLALPLSGMVVQRVGASRAVVIFATVNVAGLVVAVTGRTPAVGYPIPGVAG